MTELVENRVRVYPVLVVLTLALLTSALPRPAVAQEPCELDADCVDENPCSANICATTTNYFSLYFDRNDDVVTVPTTASLNPTTGITLSAWVRLDALGTRQAIIDKAYTSDAEPYYQYHLEVRPTGAIYFALAVNGVRKFIETTQGFGVSAGVWQHVAGTWDGTTMRVYRNGAEFWAGSTAPGNLSTYSRNVCIGNNYNVALDFGGGVDEVAIYGRGLSAEEVRDLMRRGFLNDPELRGRWSFDDGVGGTTWDSTVYGNHGTRTGAAWNSSELVDFGTWRYCFYPPTNDIPCDDGLWCTTSDFCVGGACITAPRDCEDGISCTIGACDEATDSCYQVPSDAACDDGMVCTVDKCDVALGCETTPTCVDANPCTDDWCGPAGCYYTDNYGLCSDGNDCNGLETCEQLGTCRPGTPVVEEVTGLRVYWYGTYALLLWDHPPGSFEHDLASGSLSALRADGGTSAAGCLSDNRSESSYLDPRPAPEPGAGEYYMVRAVNNICSGTWGDASDGTERSPVNACP